jgi:hypothetical protein
MSFNSYFELFYKLLKVTNFEPIKVEQSNNAPLTKRQKVLKILKRIHFWLVIALILATILSLAASALLQFSHLPAVTAILPHISFGIFTVLNTLWFLAHRNHLTNLMTLLDLNFPKADQHIGKYNTQFHFEFFRKFLKIYLLQMSLFFVSFGIEPMVKMIESGEKKYPVDIWLPFDGTQPFVYEAVYLLLSFVSISILLLNCTTDMLIFGIIFIISNEFNHLKTDFINTENLPDTKKHVELKRLVEKHESFIQIISMIESFTAPVFLFVFMQSSFLLCFCGFQVLTGEYFMKILYSTFFAVVLIRILLICAGGQRIIDASQDIANAIYEISWFEMKDLKIRKDLQLVMIQAQRGSKLTAGKFKIISLESFMAILSAALSYLTVLHTIWKSSKA